MVDILLQKIKENCTNVDLDIVNKAFNLAYEAHKEQKRESGEPYIIHPIDVASIAKSNILCRDNGYLQI